MSDYVLGKDCKLYRCATVLAATENTQSAATWVVISNVKDLTLGLETGEADVTTRANNGWKATAATLKDGSITGQTLWKPADAGFVALQSAWANGTEIALAAMDGDIETEGSQGLASNFTVTNFTRNEPLDEAVTVDFTLKPSSITDWYTVAGS